MSFCLEAIRETSEQSVNSANRLSAIIREDRARLPSLKHLAGSALRVLEVMAQKPVVSVKDVCRITGVVVSSISNAFEALVEMGVVRGITGLKRNRIFCHDRYLKVLSEGTEPLP